MTPALYAFGFIDKHIQVTGSANIDVHFKWEKKREARQSLAFRIQFHIFTIYIFKQGVLSGEH